MPLPPTDATPTFGDLLITNVTTTFSVNGPLTTTVNFVANNHQVWSEWTAATNCTTTISDGTYQVWTHWTTTATTAITASGTIVWNEWNHTHVTADFVQAARHAVGQARGVIQGVPFVPRKKTDAEVQAELLARRERERVAAEVAFKKQEAAARAEKLLFETLTSQQKDDIVKKGSFYLHTQSGRKYRIDRHTHGNVYLYDEKDRIVRKLCAQPSGVPVDDAILAQKLALETDEDAFLRVANATPM